MASKPAKKCDTCGKDGKERLMTCAKCRMVPYCSKSCQKKGWHNHKPLCPHIAVLYDRIKTIHGPNGLLKFNEEIFDSNYNKGDFKVNIPEEREKIIITSLKYVGEQFYKKFIEIARPIFDKIYEAIGLATIHINEYIDRGRVILSENRIWKKVRMLREAKFCDREPHVMLLHKLVCYLKDALTDYVKLFGDGMDVMINRVHATCSILNSM